MEWGRRWEFDVPPNEWWVYHISPPPHIPLARAQDSSKPGSGHHGAGREWRRGPAVLLGRKGEGTPNIRDSVLYFLFSILCSLMPQATCHRMVAAEVKSTGAHRSPNHEGGALPHRSEELRVQEGGASTASLVFPASPSRGPRCRHSHGK